MLVSPSLGGVLDRGLLEYEGINKSEEVSRIMDNPSRRGLSKEGEEKILSETEQRVMSQYFHDLYGVFVKKLGHFVVDPYVTPDEEIKLQALLQELIKVKKIGL